MIGNRLYLLRKAAGLSQLELGNLFGISHHTVSSYEKDKSDPSDNLKVKLAEYFGVSVDYLVGMSDEPYPVRNSVDYMLYPSALTPEQRRQVREFAQFLASQKS